MPLYEYACPDCEIAFDVFQKMSDSHLTKCPICEENTLRRLFSVPHVTVADNPKTVGQLAEYNTKRMSKDEHEEKMEHKRHKRRQALRELSKKAGANLMETSDTIPWWRDGKSFGSKYSEKPVDTSKYQNIRKYVEEGK
jgi:putative FmdB family regulatory protein